jgi:hypothetical protein
VSVAAYHFSNALRYRNDDHPEQAWFTPAYVLQPVREAFGGTIGLDPCTTADNPVGALAWYSPPEDGAALPWPAATIFVNPPYSRARERWVHRCIQAASEDRQIILLMPAATDTRIFQRAAATAQSIVFIRGRLKFGVLRPNRRQIAASHPSVLIGWNVDLTPCAHLGLLLAPVPDGQEALFTL